MTTPESPATPVFAPHSPATGAQVPTEPGNGTDARAIIAFAERIGKPLDEWQRRVVYQRFGFPSPSVVLDDSGVAVLNWPLGDNDTTPVRRDVLEQMVATHNELAALKARRCDGCELYAAAPLSAAGRCGLPVSSITAPMELDSPGPAVIELLVDADHACNAWTAKP